MSGGYFDYNQYKIHEIVNSIERELNNQGKIKDATDPWDKEYYEKYPEEKHYPTYSKEVQDKFKEAIKALKVAEVYSHEIDWLLSGDTGNDSFLENLKCKLENIK